MHRLCCVPAHASCFASPHSLVQVPLKFQLLGYDDEPWNAIPSYIPPLLDQPLLAGAEEESGGAPVPSAVVPAPDDFPSMPFCFAETPYESNPIAGRYTDDTLMSAPVTSWGVADANRIQPAVFAHEDTTESHDVASNCCRALRGTPLLSDNWLPRREYWQVMPVEVPELMLGGDQKDVLPEDKDDLRRPPVSRLPSSCACACFALCDQNRSNFRHDVKSGLA